MLKTQTPEQTTSTFFQQPTAFYKTFSDLGKSPSPIQRSSQSMTAATVEHHVAPRIIDAKDSSLASTKSNFKPEIAKMHTEILTLHDKIKQLEE
jgi:hypothetical protein